MQLSKKDLRSQVEEMGWRSISDELWKKLEDIKQGLVILSPPLDTVPSSQGNAIYTIVQDLVERCPVPCLVLSIWPTKGLPGECSISDQILYCLDPLRPVIGEKLIPYRIKRAVWGTGRPELLNYARKAADLCEILGAKTILVEDIPLYGLVIKRRANIEANIFLHQHNSAPLSYSKRWWKKISNVYKGIVFVAKKTMADTEKKHGKLDNAIVIYNGIDLDRYNPVRWVDPARGHRNQLSINDSDLVLLFVGRIIPGKGCLELVEAFLKASVPSSKLVLIGSLENSLYGNEDYSSKISFLVKENSEKVKIIGSIPQENIPGWYQVADIIVVPSVQSEGLPKVITEALAMGKPVLTSDRGGTLELVRPGTNGWVINNLSDIALFSQQLVEITQNKDNIEKFKKNAYLLDRPRQDILLTAKAIFNFVLQKPGEKLQEILINNEGEKQ